VLSPDATTKALAEGLPASKHRPGGRGYPVSSAMLRGGRRFLSSAIAAAALIPRRLCVYGGDVADWPASDPYAIFFIDKTFT